MSESPSQDLAGDLVDSAQEALSPDAIESVLADFRAWLQLAAGQPAFPLPSPPETSATPIDLHTLLGQFVALRHEVNLHTKASRAQQEQNTDTLQQLSLALQALRQAQNAAQQADQQSQDERLRPVLKTLVDLADVLGLARREVQRVQEATASTLEEVVSLQELTRREVLENQAATSLVSEEIVAPPAPVAPPPEPQPHPWWSRWFSGPTPGTSPAEPVASSDNVFAAPDHVQQPEPSSAESEPPPDDALAAREGVQQFEPSPAESAPPRADVLAAQERVLQLMEQMQRVFDSVAIGYTMSVQRVERALQQHGLDPIPTQGESFDPELMEVLEVVSDSDQPPGTVIDEVRRGYLWRGRVFRYAQVRVAR